MIDFSLVMSLCASSSVNYQILPARKQAEAPKRPA
jgi:hypothetical protein